MYSSNSYFNLRVKIRKKKWKEEKKEKWREIVREQGKGQTYITYAIDILWP